MSFKISVPQLKKPITPRTFKIGIYEGLDIVSDKSENSENRNIPPASQNFPRENIDTVTQSILANSSNKFFLDMNDTVPMGAFEKIEMPTL